MSRVPKNSRKVPGYTEQMIRTEPALILCCVDDRYVQAIQRFVKRRFRVFEPVSG